MKKIVVFIPTYNEVENIEILIHQIFEVLPEGEILIVDDNSPDGTAEKVKQLQQKYKNLHLIVRKENRGRGAAGIEGFKKAVELNADIIVEMDGDLSHSPYEIKKLINSLEISDTDIVVGSRYIAGGKDVERNIIRKVISLLARLYLKIVTGIPLKDLTSGFKVYKADVIKTILPYLKSTDPFIVTEVNFVCKKLKFKFKEVPIEFHKRYSGKSKLTLGKIMKYLYQVWGLIFNWFLKRDKYNLYFIFLSVTLTFFRLIILSLFGLTDDESHYWQYSQYLDFSYYDHPPAVGYLIHLGTSILGNNLYGVRIPAVICFLIASLYFYFLVKELYDSKTAFLSVTLLNFIPVLFTGSIITIPEVLLGMFGIMYIFYFYKFLISEDTWWLYLSGIFLGFAGLSKYTAVLLAVSTIISIFVFKKTKWLLKKEFYIFCLLSITISSPVLLWNIAHNFVSFKYQINRGIGGDVVVSLSTFLENLGAQALYFSPIVFLSLLYCLFYLLFKKKTEQEKLLLIFSLPGILLFNFVGAKNRILSHWLAIFYIPLIPTILTTSKSLFLYISSLVSSAISTITLVLVVIFGLIPIPLELQHADTPDKLYGWEVAATELARLIKEYPQNIIITHKHYTAGQLRFAYAKVYSEEISKKIKFLPQIFCINDYIDQYDFWSKELINYEKKDAIFIVEDRFFSQKDLLIKNLFLQCNFLSEKKYRKYNIWPERKFLFFLCKNFQSDIFKKYFVDTTHNNFTSVKEFYRDYDKQIFLKINKNKFAKTKSFKLISFLFSNLGNGFVVLPLMGILIFLIDRKNFVYNYLVFCIIALTGGIIIHLLKQWFDTARPLKLFTEILRQPINVIGEPLRETGFPSGHTFLAFNSAIFLSDRIKKWYISILLFIISIFVGISRICVGAHFLSDVIGGIIVAILYTSICLKIENELT